MNIYCIGIGGIGLSALARYYKSQGHQVSGSDSADSELITSLRNEGISVTIGADASHIRDDVDLVVYTIAIADTNVEYLRAKELGIRTMTYPEALGEVTKEKTTIAICGTHGKTTTTAMMYYAMKACGVNPTLIVGSLLADKGTNFVAGDGEPAGRKGGYMIVEACEYKRSFLNLNPTHVIVTNIDEDHLDYYKDMSDIHNAFQSFADALPATGILVTHSNVSLDTQAKKIDADCIDAKSIDLTVFGDHNHSNAQLVLAMIQALGLDEGKAREGLKAFPGTWRRMEYKGVTKANVAVYDDYGHHPVEIRATYQALRAKYPKHENTIVMLFQPHLYSRTKLLFDDFVAILKDVDDVRVLPIYKARLEDTTVTSEQELVDAINAAGGNAQRIESLADIPAFIDGLTDSKTIVVNMGAGDAFAELNKVTLTK